MPLWMYLLSHLSLLAFALLAGVFLAFSDFIMRALIVTEGPGGPAAMQAINREVFRYIFIPTFLAMVPVSLLLAAGATLTLATPFPFLLAAAIYCLGSFGVTAAMNVPMNNALAALDAGSDAGLAYWHGTYVPRWTFWNTVRAIACFAAAVAILWGLAENPATS